MQGAGERRSRAPYVAAALAIAYPLAVAVGGWALAGVTAAGAVAACATVLSRRPSAPLRLALGAILGWLALALAGALLLNGHTVRGLAWALLVLYAAPLVAIPWIYARTFEGSQVRRFES